MVYSYFVAPHRTKTGKLTRACRAQDGLVTHMLVVTERKTRAKGAPKKES